MPNHSTNKDDFDYFVFLDTFIHLFAFLSSELKFVCHSFLGNDFSFFVDHVLVLYV